MIEYPCPHCGAAMSSPDSMIGKMESCPACKKRFRVVIPADQLEAPEPSGDKATARPSRSYPLLSLAAVVLLIAGVLGILLGLALRDAPLVVRVSIVGVSVAAILEAVIIYALHLIAANTRRAVELLSRSDRT